MRPSRITIDEHFIPHPDELGPGGCSVTCTEFLAILDDLIDDSVAAQTRAEVELHLKKCGHCEVIFNTTREDDSRSIAATKSTKCRKVFVTACTQPSWHDAKMAANTLTCFLANR